MYWLHSRKSNWCVLWRRTNKLRAELNFTNNAHISKSQSIDLPQRRSWTKIKCTWWRSCRKTASYYRFIIRIPNKNFTFTLYTSHFIQRTSKSKKCEQTTRVQNVQISCWSYLVEGADSTDQQKCADRVKHARTRYSNYMKITIFIIVWLYT